MANPTGLDIAATVAPTEAAATDVAATGALPGASGPIVKAPTSKTAPMVQGNFALDPTETQKLLDNMQKLIDEKTSPYAQFQSGLEDMSAWGSGGKQGPAQALALRAAQRQKDEEGIQKMRMDMALTKAGMAQAQNDNALQARMTGKGAATTTPVEGAVPVAPGSAPTQAGGTTDPETGIYIPPEQLQRESMARNGTEWRAIREEYLKTAAGKKAEFKYSGAAQTQGKYFIKSLGENVYMTPDEWLEFKATNVLPDGTRLSTKDAKSVTEPTTSAAAPSAAVSPTGVNQFNVGNVRPSGKSTGFQQPIDYNEGLKIMDTNLQDYAKKGVNTLEGIITRWSPPNENETQALIKSASQRLGLDPKQPIDLTNPAVRQAIGTAIMLQEKGPKGIFGAPKAASAAAPTEGGLTSPTGAPRKATSPEQLEAQNKEALALSEQRNKDSAVRENALITQGKKAEKNVKEYNQFIDIVKETPEAFGITQRPGVAPGLMDIAETGAQLPLVGNVSIPGIQDAAAKMTLGEKAIQNRATGKAFINRQALAYRKEVYEGTGPISDAETKAASTATGLSENNPAATNLIFAVLNGEREQLAEDRYKGWVKYQEKEQKAGRTPRFYDYENTPYFMKESVDAMDKRIAQRLPSIVGKKAEKDESGRRSLSSFGSNQ